MRLITLLCVVVLLAMIGIVFAEDGEISFAGEKITGKITQAHDPPVVGKELNRVERGESYVKDFKRLVVGTLHLKKGKGILEIKEVFPSKTSSTRKTKGASLSILFGSKISLN